MLIGYTVYARVKTQSSMSAAVPLTVSNKLTTCIAECRNKCE